MSNSAEASGSSCAAPAADAQSAATVAAASTAIAGLSPENQQRLDKINVLLDEQIRPYLQGDGGDLHVLGLDGNTLSVHYQGACGTCPSSIAGTLAGIENLVKSIEPDIEVVAIQGDSHAPLHSSVASGNRT